MSPRGLVQAARDAAYQLAVASRWPAYRRRRSGAAVFAFHNVTAGALPPHSDASLHVPLPAFEAYLAAITGAYEVVPLEEIAERVRARRPVGGLAALTFDDAYRGVLRHAVPLLARHRLPATLFVVTGATAAPAAFWWDLLGEGGGVPAAVRERALHECAGDREAILAAFPPRGATVPDELLPGSWLEVRAAARAGMTIGAHTVTHRNLAALPPTEVRDELEHCRAEIAAAVGTVPVEVSYPYGAISPAVVDAARDAGYRAGVTTRSGPAAGGDPLALNRINVPAGISLAALECRAAGLQLRRDT